MQELFVTHKSGIVLTGNASLDKQRLDAIYVNHQSTEPGAEFSTNLSAESEELKPDWGSAFAGIIQDAGPTFFANTAPTAAPKGYPIQSDEWEEMPDPWGDYLKN